MNLLIERDFRRVGRVRAVGPGRPSLIVAPTIRPIVTEITPAPEFYEAEDYHQQANGGWVASFDASARRRCSSSWTNMADRYWEPMSGPCRFGVVVTAGQSTPRGRCTRLAAAGPSTCQRLSLWLLRRLQFLAKSVQGLHCPHLDVAPG